MHFLSSVFSTRRNNTLTMWEKPYIISCTVLYINNNMVSMLRFAFHNL